MGRYNSSITRVQPVFQELLAADQSGQSWLPRLLSLATVNHAYAGRLARDHGGLAAACSLRRSYADRELRETIPLEGCFEASLPPPEGFLRWLIEHPDRMVWPLDRSGARMRFGPETQLRREQLFGQHGPAAQAEARQIALGELARVGARGSERKWWAFEGFTSIDCWLETDRLVLCVEGKRRDVLSPSTSWYPGRNQLLRNLEVTREQASGREYAVLVLAEQAEEALSPEAIAASLPHLSTPVREDLETHYLGCATWSALCRGVGISYDALPDTVEAVVLAGRHGDRDGIW
jgi:hypothetical protein